jgi:protease IV
MRIRLILVMEPMPKRRPDRPSGIFILGTGAVLVIAFIALIVLFFAFNALTPSIVGKCVAVVNLDAPIAVDGSSPSLLSAGSPGSADIASSIDAINQRDDVGSVLLVVNSPGGSVVGTREIYNSVKGLNKPKVAYFREVAASGAYYISTGTDYIVSDPDTLTGSIGVVTTVMDLSGLLDKLGVNVTEVTSGPHKDIGSPYRNMTPEEMGIMQGVVNEIYGEFKSIVLENRKGRLNMTMFDDVTDGRILTGRQALAAGLVDAVGTKDDALMKAAELGNISVASVSDIRVCPIQAGASGGGLFNMDAVIRTLTARSGTPALAFK